MQESKATLSPMYKAMIYFVVGQLHFYRSNVKPELTIGRFREANADILKWAWPLG